MFTLLILIAFGYLGFVIGMFVAKTVGSATSLAGIGQRLKKCFEKS